MNKKITLLFSLIFTILTNTRLQAICDCSASGLAYQSDDRMTRQIVVDTYATLTCCCTCLDTAIADLNDTVTNCCDDVITTVTTCCDELQELIDAQALCDATPLTQDDVVLGELHLTESTHYCVAENIAAVIFMDTNFQTLDLNTHTLTGRIEILGSRDVVKNGSIVTPPPTNNTDAAQAAIVISGDSNALQSCAIRCIDTPFPGVNGRSCIELLAGKNLTIEHSGFISGSAGTGADALTAIIADNSTISQCIITTGAGYNGADGIFGENNTITNCNITTGDGIETSGAGIYGGERTVVRGCVIKTGLTTVGADFPIIPGVGVLAGHNSLITNCAITTGDHLQSGLNINNPGTVLYGADSQIINCKIQTGNGGDMGGIGIVLGVPGLDPAVNNLIQHCFITTGSANGVGGFGILINYALHTTILNSQITTGYGNVQGGWGIGVASNLGVTEDTFIRNCYITTGSGQDGGSGIPINALNTTITQCAIVTGNGANNGGNAIDILNDQLLSENVYIEGCIITTGSGSNSNGGTGIRTAALHTSIIDCTITTGSGASNGGHGVDVTSSNSINANDTNIRGCAITTGSGINGGHGVNTIPNTLNTEVRNCTFAGAASPNGLAINDQSSTTVPADNTSKMFSNFAFDIGNTPKYIVNNQGSGINNDAGVSVYAGPTTFDNVFVP